jgi:carbon-monoxide dehydrogenase medium subunit
MHLPPFVLHRPRHLDEALELLSRHGEEAALYMGGTELLLLMKLGFAEPAHLVDGKAIEQLRGLDVRPGRLLIGAGVTHRRLERHGDLRRLLPTLSLLSRRVANVRVRNAGTLGGNLCFAEPHSDPLTMLVALDACVELASTRGVRRLALADFSLGAFLTALSPGEVMTTVDVPLPPAGTRVGYQRLAFKERPDAAVAVVLTPGASRVVVGALGPRAVRVPAAEGLLDASGGADVDGAAEAVREALTRSDTAQGSDYRAHLGAVLLRRAVATALPVGAAA